MLHWRAIKLSSLFFIKCHIFRIIIWWAGDCHCCCHIVIDTVAVVIIAATRALCHFNKKHAQTKSMISCQFFTHLIALRCLLARWKMFSILSLCFSLSVSLAYSLCTIGPIWSKSQQNRVHVCECGLDFQALVFCLFVCLGYTKR